MTVGELLRLLNEKSVTSDYVIKIYDAYLQEIKELTINDVEVNDQNKEIIL